MSVPYSIIIVLFIKLVSVISFLRLYKTRLEQAFECLTSNMLHINRNSSDKGQSIYATYGFSLPCYLKMYARNLSHTDSSDAVKCY